MLTRLTASKSCQKDYFYPHDNIETAAVTRYTSYASADFVEASSPQKTGYDNEGCPSPACLRLTSARQHETAKAGYEDHPLSCLHTLVICGSCVCQCHGHQPDERRNRQLARFVCSDSEHDVLEGRSVHGYLRQ
jgi:hypothetical protein